MSYKYFAETMNEANAIIDYLEDRYEDYSGSVAHHNLLVSWRETELTNEDWQTIHESVEWKYEE